MIHAQAYEVIQVCLPDFAPGRRLPGDRQGIEAVLQTAHYLPGTVLASAHRDQAIISFAPGLGVRDHLAEIGFTRLPIDFTFAMGRCAAIAKAVGIEDQVRSGVR